MTTIQLKTYLAAAVVSGSAALWGFSNLMPWIRDRMFISSNPTYDLVAIGLSITFAVFVTLLAVGIVDAVGDHIGLRGASKNEVRGTVTAKYYNAPTTSTGVGIAINPSGGVSPVVTSNFSDEEYTIEIKLATTGEKMRIPVEENVFDSLEKGDYVKSFFQLSSFSGVEYWSSDIVKIDRQRGGKDQSQK